MSKFSCEVTENHLFIPTVNPVLTAVMLAVFFIFLAGGAGHAEAGRPEVRVGSELEFPPYAFVDERGQPAGFSVDLIRAVADAMGLSISIATGPWDTVWNDLVAGRIDVLPLVAKLSERTLLVDFSLPHTETFDSFFVRQGTGPIQNIKAADGKEIVVMRSDAAHHALLEKGFQGRLILVDTIPEGLSLVSAGKHDAFLCSKLIGTLAIRKHGIKRLTAGPPIPDYKRVFSFAVKKGDTELLEKLNQGLMIIKINGTYERLYEKWLSVDDPWQILEKYLAPAVTILIAVALIAGIWLLMLQRVVRKRTRELAESNIKLRQAHEELEERVEKRTIELTRANKALQTEITERRKVEAGILRVKEEWERTFNSVPDLIAILNREYRIVRVNRAMAEMLGTQADECVGLQCFACVHGTSVPPAVCPHTLSMEDGREHTAEVHEDRFDGDFLVTTTPLFDEAGEIMGSVHVARNITERKKAEEALRQSETQLKRSQEIAHLGSWELDLVDNVLTWSDEVYRIFGLQPQEFAATYEAFLEAVHPDDRAAVDEAYNKSIREGRDSYEIVHRVVKKSTGEIRHVHEKCEHNRDESGRIIRSVGMVHDITEQNQREEELRSAYARYRSFIEVTGQIGWTTNPEGEVVDDLPEWRNYTGQSFDDIKGWGWSNALHPDDLDYTAAEWEKSVRGKSRYEVEYRIRRHDGMYRNFLARGTPVFDKDGTIREWVGTCIDITERKQAEEEREKLLEELKRSNTELEQFAYVASHDLQEPLRMISSYIELVLTRYRDRLDEDADEFIGYIVDGAAHMQTLLNDLLAYSRVGSRMGPLQPVDLNSALDRAIMNLRTVINETHADITREGLPNVSADRVQMVQLLQNIIANAVKFRREEPPRIHVYADHDEKEWTIRIRDNGIGIDPRYYDKLFVIFKRLHSRAEYPGTGIGLAVCKKIAEHHGGRIWVESEPGKGSTFCFTIAKKGLLPQTFYEREKQ